MAALGARRLPLSTKEQSAIVVPEAAPAEERRQQVSELIRANRSLYTLRKFSGIVCFQIDRRFANPCELSL